LANTETNLGNFYKAKDDFSKVLEIIEIYLGDEPIEKLKIISNVTKVLYILRDFKAAKEGYLK
jgi:hypothetical protein